MKIFFLLLNSIIGGIILFKLNKIKFKFSPMFAIILFVLLITFLLVKVFKIQPTNAYNDISLSLMIGSGVLTSIIWVIHTVLLLLDTVIDFHKTYNAQNVNRFPISFFIYHRDKIILGFKIIF